MTREEKMEQLTINLLQSTPRRTSRRRRRRRNFSTTRRRKRNQRIPKEILQMFDAILVRRRDTLQEIVPLGKRDTMLILSKMMNQQTKDSDRRMMLHMKSMC